MDTTFETSQLYKKMIFKILETFKKNFFTQNVLRNHCFLIKECLIVNGFTEYRMYIIFFNTNIYAKTHFDNFADVGYMFIVLM